MAVTNRVARILIEPPGPFGRKQYHRPLVKCNVPIFSRILMGGVRKALLDCHGSLARAWRRWTRDCGSAPPRVSGKIEIPYRPRLQRLMVAGGADDDFAVGRFYFGLASHG